MRSPAFPAFEKNAVSAFEKNAVAAFEKNEVTAFEKNAAVGSIEFVNNSKIPPNSEFDKSTKLLRNTTLS